jgi:hypothetical protein
MMGRSESGRDVLDANSSRRRRSYASIRAKFLLDGDAQCRQGAPYGIPYETSDHVFIVVAINVSRRRHLFPRYRRVTSFHLSGNAPGRFGNDLKAACNGIHRPQIGSESFAVNVTLPARCDTKYPEERRRRD